MDYHYEYIRLNATHTRVKAMHDQQIANLKREIAQLRDLINNPVIVPHFDRELEELLDVVVSVTNILAYDILGRSRKREIVTARTLFSYIARTHCRKELTTIGRFLNMDHSSIINQVSRFEDYLSLNYKTETDFYNECLHRINTETGKGISSHDTDKRAGSNLLRKEVSKERVDDILY